MNKVKYAYQRPIFLQLFTDDEIQVIATISLKHKVYNTQYNFTVMGRRSPRFVLNSQLILQQVTADHLVRPIMVPRDVNILPWYAGYAEAINAGKSLRNEDQAAFHRGVLRTQDLPDDEQYATGKANMK